LSGTPASLPSSSSSSSSVFSGGATVFSILFSNAFCRAWNIESIGLHQGRTENACTDYPVGSPSWYPTGIPVILVLGSQLISQWDPSYFFYGVELQRLIVLFSHKQDLKIYLQIFICAIRDFISQWLDHRCWWHHPSFGGKFKFSRSGQSSDDVTNFDDRVTHWWSLIFTDENSEVNFKLPFVIEKHN
jgi:hypothetical protein